MSQVTLETHIVKGASGRPTGWYTLLLKDSVVVGGSVVVGEVGADVFAPFREVFESHVDQDVPSDA